MAADLPPSSHEHIKALCFLLVALKRLPLGPAVGRHMRAPGAAATLHHAVGVVAAVSALAADLPASVAAPISVLSSTRLGMHSHAAQLLAACCSGLSCEPVSAVGSETSSVPQQSGGSDSGSSSGSGSGAAAGTSDQQLEVAWELVAAVPHVCSAVRALLDSTTPGNLVDLQVLSAVADWYGGCVGRLRAQVVGVPCSAEQLSAWAAAVEDSHRLLPLLVQHDTSLLQQQHLQQQAGNLWQQAATLLAAQLVSALYAYHPQLATSVPGGNVLEQPGTPALRRQLLRAHLAGCRLVHWLAQQAPVSRALLLLGGYVGAPTMLMVLIDSLCQTLLRLFQLEDADSGWAAGCALFSLHRVVVGGRTESFGGGVSYSLLTISHLSAQLPCRSFSADLQAAFAAHIEAATVLTGLAAAARSADGGDAGVPAPEAGAMPGLSGSLSAALIVVPSLAAPAALAPVEALLPAMLQVTLLCSLSRLGVSVMQCLTGLGAGRCMYRTFRVQPGQQAAKHCHRHCSSGPLPANRPRRRPVRWHLRSSCWQVT